MATKKFTRLLLLFICLSFFSMLLTSCKKDDRLSYPCAINSADESSFSIQIFEGSNESLNYPVFCFLSDHESGEIIQVEEFQNTPMRLGSSCAQYNSFDLTFLRVWDDPEGGEKQLYNFKTYMNVPNNMDFYLETTTSISLGKIFNLTIEGIESYQYVGNNQGLTIGTEEQINDSTFYVRNLRSLYNNYYVKIWANNDSPRFTILRNVDEHISVNYNNISFSEDTTRIRFNKENKWKYHLEGVFDNEIPFSRVRIEEKYVNIAEASNSIVMHTPSSGIEGYLLFVSGSLGSVNSRVEYKKFHTELPELITIKDVPLEITRHDDEITIAPIQGAIFANIYWFIHNDDEKTISWSVTGPVSEGFHFKHLRIPEAIRAKYPHHLSDFTKAPFNIANIMYYDNLSSYEQYLTSVFNGDLNNLTNYYNGQELYVIEY